MTATTTDRLDGLASATAIKGPCKAASTTNLTLSGEQAVNAVSIVADDRVLVTGQTDGTENGVYVASTGAWRRAKDFSSNNDIRTGTQVRVNSGTNAGIWVLTTADPVTIDTSTITFTRDTDLTSGALLAANNLSDVASAVAALWNLRNNGANIASAATLVLNNATGDQVDVTGAVTITAVTLAEDREVWVRFTGAPQITVGASLIGNAGGANITMAAGDIARFRGYAAGVVRFTVFPISGSYSNIKAGGTASYRASSIAGQLALVEFETGGVDRWLLGKNSTAESGANAGADLDLYSYGDAGAFIATVLRVTRSTGALRLFTPLGGLGYGVGAGGAVTQATDKATGVTLSKVCGQITMNGAALGAGTVVSFTLTNTAIAAGDVLVLNHLSGGTVGAYSLNAQCAAGSAVITVRNNTAGSLSEAIVIAFALVRAVAS